MRDGRPDDEPLLLGLLCNEAVVEYGDAVGGNPLDVAPSSSPALPAGTRLLCRAAGFASADSLPGQKGLLARHQQVTVPAGARR